jgi:hypothetical protein
MVRLFPKVSHLPRSGALRSPGQVTVDRLKQSVLMGSQKGANAVHHISLTYGVVVTLALLARRLHVRNEIVLAKSKTSDG